MGAKHLSSWPNGLYNQFFDSLTALHVIWSFMPHIEAIRANTKVLSVEGLVNILKIQIT
jgi:hypothetical protein